MPETEQSGSTQATSSQGTTSAKDLSQMELEHLADKIIEQMKREAIWDKEREGKAI